MNALAVWAAMGGYAGYVWPAYGVAALVLGVLAVASLRGERLSRRRLHALEARRGEGDAP